MECRGVWIQVELTIRSRLDENFYVWVRLLNTYKDVISEMQARLK